MERLTAFAKRWSRAVPGIAGCWLGDISDVRASHRVREIARRGGFEPPSDLQLPEVRDVVASRIIAYGIRNSLVHGKIKYRVSEANELLEMLQELGPVATFWSNQSEDDFADGRHLQPARRNQSITRAMLELGVIAANETTGFIWWRGEDD